eukprot:1179048-Prorocentrum_minimum.AAC.3
MGQARGFGCSVDLLAGGKHQNGCVFYLKSLSARCLHLIRPVVGIPKLQNQVQQEYTETETRKRRTKSDCTSIRSLRIVRIYTCAVIRSVGSRHTPLAD